MSGPSPVAFGVAALFRALPGPDLDSTARDTWLEAKAAFFDRIADAAATPDLAADLRACATATRSHLTAAQTASQPTARRRPAAHHTDGGPR